MEQKKRTIELRPQEGPQERFLSSTADIVVYGGAAGGGKSFALLLEAARNKDVSGFGAVFFRRTMAQIINEGGLWDTALQVYVPLGAGYKSSPKPTIIWPSGAKITFSHLQYEDDVYGWQGAQICLILFDELTHFTESQFWYMLSRNRSTCGIRPYVRATCNPDADSWVASLISWWVDQKTGYAIPERSGQIRYVYRVEDVLHWGDTREEVARVCKLPMTENGLARIKSFTFIASSIYDNKILLDMDPGYLANLDAQTTVNRERLLKGNWKIRPSAGLYFRGDMFRITSTIPDKIISVARAWDLAATEITPKNSDPDRTASCLMARLRNGQIIILDVKRVAYNADNVRQLVKSTAIQDRAMYNCNKVLVPQDPGQAGKEQAQSYVRLLSGFNIVSHPVSGDKVTRAEPFAASAQHGNILALKASWNDSFFLELEGFPDAAHDDQVDAASDAFSAVSNCGDWSGLIT